MDARELTRDEKKKIRTLVTGMCANYDRESGLCLPLDCACYMLLCCTSAGQGRTAVISVRLSYLLTRSFKRR